MKLREARWRAQRVLLEAAPWREWCMIPCRAHGGFPLGSVRVVARYFGARVACLAGHARHTGFSAFVLRLCAGRLPVEITCETVVLFTAYDLEGVL